MTQQGAAEQSLSRDTNRLGARLDFYRLTSFYFGGLGYYIGNFITVATIVFVVYFMLALAVSLTHLSKQLYISHQNVLSVHVLSCLCDVSTCK
jgi:1,3-beta-glucan synthase